MGTWVGAQVGSSRRQEGPLRARLLGIRIGRGQAYSEKAVQCQLDVSMCCCSQWLSGRRR